MQNGWYTCLHDVTIMSWKLKDFLQNEQGKTKMIVWTFEFIGMAGWKNGLGQKYSPPLSVFLAWTWMASFYISNSPISLLTSTLFYSVFHNSSSIFWNKSSMCIILTLLSSAIVLWISILFSMLSIWLWRSLYLWEMWSS